MFKLKQQQKQASKLNPFYTFVFMFSWQLKFIQNADFKNKTNFSASPSNGVFFLELLNTLPHCIRKRRLSQPVQLDKMFAVCNSIFNIR